MAPNLSATLKWASPTVRTPNLDSTPASGFTFTLAGIGLFTSTNGERYEGQWSQGERHGQGSWIGPNREKYEGEFCEGVEQGMGKYAPHPYF